MAPTEAHSPGPRPRPRPARQPRSRTTPRAAYVGVAVVLALIGAMVLLSVLSTSGTVDVRFGDREFWAGSTERLADEIDDRGPYLLPDASPKRSLDIFVQHLGDDPDEGWLAFLARSPGNDDRGCTLEWDGGRFTDPCGDATYPPDGTGLEQFTTRVEDGSLYVDFGAGSAE